MTAPRIAPVALDDERRNLIAPSKAAGSSGTNWFATAVRNTGLYQVWRPMAMYLNSESVLPFRDRELVVLRIGWLCQSEYEWGQHVLVARRGGITDDEIARVRAGSTAAGWTAHEAALVRVPDQLREHSSVDDETWAVLSQEYDDAQLIELVMLAGHYFMISFALNALGVQAEEGAPGL